MNDCGDFNTANSLATRGKSALEPGQLAYGPGYISCKKHLDVWQAHYYVTVPSILRKQACKMPICEINQTALDAIKYLFINYKFADNNYAKYQNLLVHY